MTMGLDSVELAVAGRRRSARHPGRRRGGESATRLLTCRTVDVGDSNDVRPVATVGEAAAILRPALMLWLVIELVWGAYYLCHGYGDPSWPGPAPLLLSYLAVTAFTAVLIVRSARSDPEARRVLARPRRGMVELCLLAGIVGGLALAMLENGIREGSGGQPFLERELGWPLPAALLTIAVLPAVLEELMFRGVILHRLRLVIDTRLAIGVQAMLFAAMHLDGVYLLPHFAFGCLAGFLRVAAGALWPCMLMHLVWNGWIVLAAWDVL